MVSSDGSQEPPFDAARAALAFSRLRATAPNFSFVLDRPPLRAPSIIARYFGSVSYLYALNAIAGRLYHEGNPLQPRSFARLAGLCNPFDPKQPPPLQNENIFNTHNSTKTYFYILLLLLKKNKGYRKAARPP